MSRNFQNHSVTDTWSFARYHMDQAILAKLTNFLGEGFPDSQVPYQFTIEKGSQNLYVRNGADTQWILLGKIVNDLGRLRLDAATPMESNLDAGDNLITGVQTPTNNTDIANLAYLDSKLKIEGGSYSGNSSSRTINLATSDLLIKYIRIMVVNTGISRQSIIKTPSFATTASREYGGTYDGSGAIEDISTAGEFDLGTDTTVNNSGDDYSYLVMGIKQ